jgi:hypothetical protein
LVAKSEDRFPDKIMLPGKFFRRIGRFLARLFGILAATAHELRHTGRRRLEPAP